ncbi:indc11 [Verticillium dahliae VdLs.17]|uniref:Indc11 n=1 Tax=Verticillium dahliae (strain VdLs.17 / ATCC MYA-4575 / FGSC 10137) TaxID=498257 RepID=G2X9R4_VERDV|nr:indc11 [Verticillium dahliae VdLs.17]EGY15945.1 indc11 [Verticillium dahliae VdLs.17]
MTPIRRALISGFGDASHAKIVTETIDAPGKNEVQVDVIYSGFSGADINMRLGMYPQQKTAPLYPGYCFVGRVAVNGRKSNKFRPGRPRGRRDSGRVGGRQDQHRGKVSRRRAPERRHALGARGRARLEHGVRSRAPGHDARGPGQAHIHPRPQRRRGLCHPDALPARGATSTARRHCATTRRCAAWVSCRSCTRTRRGWARCGGAAAHTSCTTRSASRAMTSRGRFSCATSPVASSVSAATSTPYRPAAPSRGRSYRGRSSSWPRTGVCGRKRSAGFYYIDRTRDTYVPDLQAVLQLLAEGKFKVPIKKIWDLDNIREPHEQWTKVTGMGSCLIRVDQNA